MPAETPAPPECGTPLAQLDALAALGWWLWNRAATPTERIDYEHARLLIDDIAAEVTRVLAELRAMNSPAVEGKRISYVNGLVDDVAITGNLFRMEQMDRDAWWVCIYRGERRTAFCLRWDRKTKNIIANVTDDNLPPAEATKESH